MKAIFSIILLLGIIGNFGFAQCTCTNGCSSLTVISMPFTKDGAGEFCYQASCIGSPVNSWNMDTVSINGLDFTNKWADSSTLPAPASDGYYYIYYKASYSWSHFEAQGACSGAATILPTSPSSDTLAPTSPPGETAAPTDTPAPTNPAGDTAVPTSPPVNTTVPTSSATESPSNPPVDTTVPGGTTTANNPLIRADVPDVDVIRVGNDFYMSSTSMHTMPGVPIMHSTDLANWEIVSYVYSTLENNDAHNLLNGQSIYGKGSWASSLRYNNGTFYCCFVSNDMGRTYIYKTSNISGSWTRIAEISAVYHDPSILFDTDGRVYIIYGVGTIKIIELTSDLASIKSGGLNQTLFTTSTGNTVNCEGSHAYKINGMYYVLLIQWPSGGKRRELCYRSSSLTGTYEYTIVLDTSFDGRGDGVAQGGIFDTPNGQWFGMLFQDHGAVGRIPYLVSVNWSNNWPMMSVSSSVTVPLSTSSIRTALLKSDEFTSTSLGLNWQWNHNPNNSLWSLTSRSGYLRLTTGNIVSHICQARNTLTQRTVGNSSTGEIALQTENMKNGDYAGIAAFCYYYGFIGVKKNSSGQRYIVVANGTGGAPAESGSVALNQDRVILRIICNFSSDTATFSYSLDGSSWTSLGSTLTMRYTLDHFMGYRFGLFNYATTTTGGYVDFDYFHYY